jgi:hypothetical protein
MGHIRLKRLPATRKWRDVVAFLLDGAPAEQVASASSDAAEGALQSARRDPVLAYSLWLLTQLPLAAREPDFPDSAWRLGVNVNREASLLQVIGAFSDAIDEAMAGRSGRTDLGEMARKAATESLTAITGADLNGFFDPTPEEVRLAIAKLAAPDRFARLARDFFARLTRHHLDYYLSRTLANQVGPGRRLPTIADQSAFSSALDQHCREASRIVETFAGGWFSKTIYKGGITPAKARNFAFVALGKISAELKQRQASSG